MPHAHFPILPLVAIACLTSCSKEVVSPEQKQPIAQTPKDTPPSDAGPSRRRVIMPQADQPTVGAAGEGAAVPPPAQPPTQLTEMLKSRIADRQPLLQARAASRQLAGTLATLAKRQQGKWPGFDLKNDTQLETSESATQLLEAALALTTESVVGPEPVLRLPQSKSENGKITGGLARNGKSISVLDPWGRPYQLLLDGDGDGKLKNPASDPAKPELNVAAAAFSAGPDGDPTTWADNLKSW